MRRGGAVVSVTTDQEGRASEILVRNGAIDIDERAASWRAEGSDPSRLRGNQAGDDRSIPVIREELHIGKRAVHKGGIRVFNRVEEQPVEEKVRLREEHVRVDRRPADRPATEADFRSRDQVVEVTEMAEEPVVQKTARVVEEVVIAKEATERTETIRDTVRRSDVNVEQIGARDRAYDEYDDDSSRFPDAVRFSTRREVRELRSGIPVWIPHGFGPTVSRPPLGGSRTVSPDRIRAQLSRKQVGAVQRLDSLRLGTSNTPSIIMQARNGVADAMSFRARGHTYARIE